MLRRWAGARIMQSSPGETVPLRPPPPASQRAAGHRTFAPAATARIATSGRAPHLRSLRVPQERSSEDCSSRGEGAVPGRAAAGEAPRTVRAGAKVRCPAALPPAKLRGLFEQGRRCGVRPRYRRRSSEDCSSRGEGAVSGRPTAGEAPRTVRAGAKVRCPAALPTKRRGCGVSRRCRAPGRGPPRGGRFRPSCCRGSTTPGSSPGRPVVA
jgi:hypothetical protein